MIDSKYWINKINGNKAEIANSAIDVQKDIVLLNYTGTYLFIWIDKNILHNDWLPITEKEYNSSKIYLRIMEEQEKEETVREDRVSHPSHYTWLKEKCGIEPIDITRHLDFDLGNALKYILRAGHKSESGMDDKEKEIEDLQKAIFYLNDRISMLKKQ